MDDWPARLDDRIVQTPGNDAPDLLPSVGGRKPLREKVDFSMVKYKCEPPHAEDIIPIKGKANKGIWAIYQDWEETYLKSRGIKYIRTDAGKYADYASLKSVVESVGYDGCRALAVSYWQDDRWSRYEKTITAFARHATSIWENLKRHSHV